MRSPRRLLLLTVLALTGTALVACGEKPSDKKLVTLNGEGFSVRVPGKTDRQVRTIPTAAGAIDLIIYSSADKGASEGFVVSVGKIPAGGSFDLDGAVRGAAANVQGTVSDLKKTTYQGFPARDMRITSAQDQGGHKGTVFARVVLAKDRFFQLQFIQEGADVKSPPAVYPTFVSSLKIR